MVPPPRSGGGSSDTYIFTRINKSVPRAMYLYKDDPYKDDIVLTRTIPKPTIQSAHAPSTQLHAFRGAAAPGGFAIRSPRTKREGVRGAVSGKATHAIATPAPHAQERSAGNVPLRLRAGCGRRGHGSA